MKVLHVVASLSHEWGGPIPVVKGLTEMLARKGVEITIFAPVKRGARNNTVEPEGAEVRVFEQGHLSRIWTAYSSDLARTLSREVSRFDLIHIHEIWHHPHFAAYRAAKRAGKPYIVTIHGALEPWCLGHKALKKKVFTLLIQRHILQNAAALHALTQAEGRQIRAYKVTAPVIVIANGIELSSFRQFRERKELEKLYPELKEKAAILFLGRIHPKKGFDILARAFGRIARARKDVYLVVAGPDSEGYRAQVERMLESEKVLDRTIFTGMLTGQEKLAALSRADIFVLPSYSEGFSIAVLEALACELPLVITRQCHFPEVAEAKAGIVIDPDPDQLAEALITLLNNADLRRGMGDNGKRLVMERFTWDKTADQMIQLYQSVLENRG